MAKDLFLECRNRLPGMISGFFLQNLQLICSYETIPGEAIRKYWVWHEDWLTRNSKYPFSRRG